MTDTERHGPVPRRPAARLDRWTSYFDENQASPAKKPSKNDMPSPHRRRSGGPAAGDSVWGVSYIFQGYGEL